MTPKASRISVWSTIRWIEIFFVLGLPLALAAAASVGPHVTTQPWRVCASLLNQHVQTPAEQTLAGLETDAETARMAGDALRAALTYLDAASLAVSAGDRLRARKLLDHARRTARLAGISVTAAGRTLPPIGPPGR